MYQLINFERLGLGLGLDLKVPYFEKSTFELFPINNVIDRHDSAP